MEYFIAFLFLVIISALGWLIFLISKNGGKNNDNQVLLMLQQQLSQLNQSMDTKLADSAKTAQTQFSQNLKVIRDVTEKLTTLENTNKQVVGFTEQLQSLQNILTNPKQRGILGEYHLETVLKNILPPKSYQLQYAFDDGDIVDAAIFVKDKIIPVDSKFSLENYNKIVREKDKNERLKLEKQFKADLKNRIDETSKYIKPDKGTYDFAFMFIPAEGIYYDLLINQVGAITINTRDLIEYAFREKKVIIVSPTTFYAYLQAILEGLRALQIEESAKEIRKNVEALGKHLRSYDEFFHKVGNHLGTTVSMYDQAGKEWKKIDKDVLKISGEGLGIEVEQIEKPKQD